MHSYLDSVRHFYLNDVLEHDQEVRARREGCTFGLALATGYAGFALGCRRSGDWFESIRRSRFGRELGEFVAAELPGLAALFEGTIQDGNMAWWHTKSVFMTGSEFALLALGAYLAFPFSKACVESVRVLRAMHQAAIDPCAYIPELDFSAPATEEPQEVQTPAVQM